MALEAIFYLLSALCLVSGSQIYELKCWTRRDRTHYAGPGLQNSGIDDTVECINKCRENDFCRAVDIDTNTRGNCWYQQNSNFVATESDLQPADTVTNYLYNPTCGEITRGVDLNCWTVTPAHNILGLTQIDRKTLADCLSECKRRQDCWAVDWDVNTSPSCWVQTNPMEVSESRLLPSPSITNFILNRECLNLVGAVDLRFWKVSDNTQYSGLVQVDKMDLQSCINYCLSNENCNTFDFNLQTTPPCWAQTNLFTILRGRLGEKSRVFNFFLLRKDYEASRTSYAVKDIKESEASRASYNVKVTEQTSCWFYEDDFTYSDLKIVPSVKSSAQCQELCLEKSSCGAALFEASSKTCSHVDGKVNKKKLKKKVGVVIYILDRDCSQMNGSSGKKLL